MPRLFLNLVQPLLAARADVCSRQSLDACRPQAPFGVLHLQQQRPALQLLEPYLSSTWRDRSAIHTLTFAASIQLSVI